MESQRVFEIANAAGTDVTSVLRELKKLGSEITEPTKLLGPDLTRRVRHALGLPPAVLRTGPTPASKSEETQAPTAKTSKRSPSQPQPNMRPMPKQILGPEHAESVEKMIPTLYDLLLRCNNLPEDGVVVIYHDVGQVPEYGLCTLTRKRWTPRGETDITRDMLLDPLRVADRRYRDRALTPPNTFIAIDVPNRGTKFGQSFDERLKDCPLDAETLLPRRNFLDGPSAMLAPKSQLFQPEHVPKLVKDLGTSQDFPSEAFLLHEELLQLAIDSLDSDENLDPMPVHINALWVFAQPVVIQQPYGSERWVRAVWYRQGEAFWRIRTYVAGIGKEPKEVGERLAGRLPFAPVWDETRPEQKLLAAVWALMTQGGVTESEQQRQHREPFAAGFGGSDLTIVRIKAGTGHAQVYRSDDPSNTMDRPAWSVRGHWRHQPYPSLGRDEGGRIRTKMVWIATYNKGDLHSVEPQEKVIIVRP